MKTLRFKTGSRIRAQADGTRRLNIIAYTGDVMTVSGYGPLVVDLAGLDIPPSIPLLADHENALGSVVGTGRAESDGKGLTVAGSLATTEAANDVYDLLKSDVALQASIGCESLAESQVAPGEVVEVNGRKIKAGKRGFTLVSKSSLLEVSVVPLGADRSTAVLLAARAAGESAMSFEEWLGSLKLDAADLSDEQKTALTDAYNKLYPKASDDDDEDKKPGDTEAKRAAAVVDVMAGTSHKLLAQAIKERWSVNRARNEALTHLRASRPGAGVGSHRGGEFSTGTKPLEAALLVRAGMEGVAIKAYGAEVLEESRPYHRASFIDIIAASLRMQGFDVPRDPNEIVRIAASGASGSSVPTLLSNALNKTLEMVWQASPATWRSWTTPRSANDFKPQTSLRPIFSGNLRLTGPTGEIQHGTIAEFYFQWAVRTFSKIYSIPRQHIINDDLSAFSEVMPSFAQAGLRNVGDLVYSTVMQNASSFFSAGNKNTQTGAGSALSAASLAKAVQQIRLQKDPAGNSLGIQPAVLVVPPALETTARALLNSDLVLRDQTADRQPMGNPFRGLAALEVEARLENGLTDPVTNAVVAGSTTGWYLFAEPANLAMVLGFLRGNQTPVCEMADMQSDFSVLAMHFRCYHDVGVSFGDPRAAQSSAGA